MRSSRRVICRVFLFPLASLIPALSVCAHAETDPCLPPASQPGDLTLNLSLKNGQTVFREGEIIPLIAGYSSSYEKKYLANTREYDRGGRLSGMEVFCIDPAAGSDPLADYFNGMMGFMGGGLSSEKVLSSDPYVVNLELNEWHSLPPGSYRLRVVSHRVSVWSEKNLMGWGGQPIPLRSNEVEFQVIGADPAWQAERLAMAERALDSASPTDEEAKHGARVLRFLGSEAATRELARRFWAGNDQPFGWDLKFGLFGSPYRATAIEAMKTALLDPRHPVTQEFVQVLALLEIQSDPKYQLPKYDEKNKEALTKAREAKMEALNKLIARHMSDAATVLQRKTAQARAVTANELLQANVALDPVVKAELQQMLLASWASLPVRRQNELIEYRWEQIGGPELLPILRQIAKGPSHHNPQTEQPDRASALRRMYEIAPGEARNLILREISNPTGDIGVNVLGMLPERELPQIEQPLIAKLQARSANDVEYQLLERYASARALAEIQSVYEAHRGEWACAPQDAMLRYFLRVNPEYGVDHVRDAMGRRKVTGCYKFQLTGLKEDIRRPELERLAIAALNDPSPEVATDAAEALRQYGSQKAEAALWTRLEKFREQRKDRADDEQDEAGLEQSLVRAIQSAQAWFSTEDTIDKLKELASPSLQTELDSMLQEIRRGEYALNLNWWPEGVLQYTLGTYSGNGMAALKEKLAQLPSGTRLNVVTTVAERGRHRVEFAEIEDAAAASGAVLQIQTPR
jgi:hypothetical protein